KLLGQFSKRVNQFIVSELFRDWFHVNGCLLQFLPFAEDKTAKPFAALMRDYVEQDAKEPGAAVGAGRKAVKRLQSLKVCLLDRVFRLRTVVQYRSGCAIKCVHVRQRLGIEPGDTSESGAHRARFAEAIAGISFRRHISIPLNWLCAGMTGWQR